MVGIFFVTPDERGDGLLFSLADAKKKRQQATMKVWCWRLGRRNGVTVVAPWLCVPAFRLVCSEQL